MNKDKISFVAYQDQENLGVGYLSSFLQEKGYETESIDFNLDDKEIYRKIKESDPLLVGFSLIFQYHLFYLADLAEYLREKGINCHFTVGGHFPSLRFDETLDHVPELDSVVRFEGEHTLYELAECLRRNRDWRGIKSIAYRDNGKPVSNDLRELIDDLDSLPYPRRYNIEKFQCMDKKYTHILASRGCVYDCTFCSIRQFYGTPPGKLKRSRSPGDVAEEMYELHDKHDIDIYLFQDDDFILPGGTGERWLHDFVDKIREYGLADKILWKISCRPDEIDHQLFKMLQDAGLRIVYLGIESGYQAGLDNFNKHLSVETNLEAVRTLKELGINYEFGFMLFARKPVP